MEKIKLSAIKITDNVFRSLSKVTLFFDENLRKEFCLNQTEILSEVFQKIWESILISEKNCFNKKSVNQLHDGLGLKSAKTFEVIKTKKVEKKLSHEEKLLGMEKEIMDVPYTEKFSDYSVKISFNFDSIKKEFSMFLENLHIKNPDRTKEEVYKEIEYEFNNLQKKFVSTLGLSKPIKEFNFNLLLEKLIDTLRSRKMFIIFGTDAIHIKEIYPKISEIFPEFKALSHAQKIDILKLACSKAISSDSRRDINIWAKSILEALVDSNLIGKIRKFDSKSENMVEFSKISESYKDIYNPDDSKDLWRKKVLTFVVYQLNGFKTSFSAFDLWNLLLPKTLTE